MSIDQNGANRSLPSAMDLYSYQMVDVQRLPLAYLQFGWWQRDEEGPRRRGGGTPSNYLRLATFRALKKAASLTVSVVPLASASKN